MPTANDIMTEVRRVYLNDYDAKLATNVTLLPILNKAYKDIQGELIDNGVSVAREKSSALTLPANTTSITSSSSPALPSDLLYPIQLDEKFSGQDDTYYVSMEERTWEPDIAKTERLNYWAWRENEIKLVGATGTTIVRIKHWASRDTLADANSSIAIIDAASYLAARTAAIAAYTIMRNPTIAEGIGEEANRLKEVFLSISVKGRQNQPISRRPFRAFRNPYWRIF